MTLTKAYLIILASFAWFFACALTFEQVDPPKGSQLADVIGWTMLSGFAILFLTGTSVWAGAKGYHPVLGLALGFVGPLGLILLVFLSDRSEKVNSPEFGANSGE